MTITESSTIMPNTTMSAASVTVFSSMPEMNISPRVTAMQTGTLEPDTKAVRSGKSSNITAITTKMENSRSRKNDITDLLTT